MTGHLFPYREEGRPPILRPSVDVRVLHGATGDWTCRALIDTGAPVTLFDRGVADALSLRLGHAGAERHTTRILGGSWITQMEDVSLELPGAAGLLWEARVGFITDPRLQMPFQGILGTEGFLDRFAVTFNKYYDHYIVERPDDSADRHAVTPVEQGR